MIGLKVRMLNVVDEFSRECLAIRVARKLKAIDVIDILSNLFILRGVPGHTHPIDLRAIEGLSDRSSREETVLSYERGL